MSTNLVRYKDVCAAVIPMIADMLQKGNVKPAIDTLKALGELEDADLAREERIGRQLTYDEQCELLKEAHLYEVEYTGPAVGRMYDHEPYVYGHAWLIQDLPDDVVKRVIEITKEHAND